MVEERFVQGNEACALGAIAANCRFFAGYPITPSTEIAEQMSILLPKYGGSFVQMEDEIASAGAIIGASWSGMKAMTATSGPGISLMQENIGYGFITETPIVIINVQKEYNFIQSIVNALGTAIGFTIAIVILAGLREKMEYNDISPSFKGMPIVLVTAGLMAIAFSGFSGIL